MIQFPNAKINLGLNIVARRPDGYHDIETIFYPIPLCDILEIVPAQDGCTTLTVYGRNIDCPTEKNLVMRACRLMQREFHTPNVNIFLTKIIPDGAGLGGGSADAAFTLRMINELFSLGADKKTLTELAAVIGADCPFFIYNTPMIATGIGEILTPIDISLEGYKLLLIKDDSISVPTKLAYSRVTPKPGKTPISQIVSKPVTEWQELLKNDFEESVFTQFPQLDELKTQLTDMGAIYAAMSGSGSSVFGIFDRANMTDTSKLNKFGKIFDMQL